MDKTYKDVFEQFGSFLLFIGINLMIRGEPVGIVLMVFGLVTFPVAIMRHNIENAEPFPSSKVYLDVSFAMTANGILFLDVADPFMLMLGLGLSFTIIGVFMFVVTLLLKQICNLADEAPMIEKES